MLFERNVWGGVSETRQTGPNNVFILQWQILAGYFTGYPAYVNEYPAAATDAFGRIVLAVKGTDGRLYIRRESSGTIGNFDGWFPVS